jgi:hypothetical protein
MFKPVSITRIPFGVGYFAPSKNNPENLVFKVSKALDPEQVLVATGAAVGVEVTIIGKSWEGGTTRMIEVARGQVGMLLSGVAAKVADGDKAPVAQIELPEPPTGLFGNAFEDDSGEGEGEPN